LKSFRLKVKVRQSGLRLVILLQQLRPGRPVVPQLVPVLAALPEVLYLVLVI
jgi:hypothetical protein